MGKKDQPEQLLETLGDFTSKENWDKFFTIRGSDDSFEWYAEWAELRDSLLSQLSEINRVQHELAQILVPGCGNSRLSEQLYDVGFKAITNIDFSKVVISDMLRRNVRQRPDMRWRIMDMTNMQFEEESFHIVLDKGALDALMEPELGPKLGNQYLSEVKRILKFGGRFICLTLAESHVLGLLFSTLRFGWKVTIYAISQQRSTKPNFQTFMVVAEKDMPTMLHQIMSSFQNSSVDCSGNQACGLIEVLENENKIRSEYTSGSDVLYSLEDLQLGAKGDLTEFFPGRRLQLALGREGVSQYIYRAVLLDALQQSGAYMYHCGVFLVPKTRAHEWLFSSEEGQWLVVESSKAARLIMVLLDSSHASASMDGIQKDLSPLVRQLAPGKGDNEAQIPFMMASDGIKQRNAIHQVNSPLTGNIIIEDVVYENVGVDVNSILPSKVITFRRLVFQRSEGLVQSEALLTSEEASQETLDENERKKSNLSSRSKRRGSQRKNAESMKVYHGYLASSYHTGILSGFMLISSYIESVASARESVKAVILGLGAGLLPMFLHGCMPFLQVEVVELDTLVRDLARSYFGLIEDERLQVHIADGIQYVKMIADSAADDEVLVHGNEALFDKKASSSFSSCVPSSNGEGITTAKFDIVIVDVDSADSSSALTCPAAPFVEKSFLQTVKNTLSREGLFVVNLVSRSRAIKNSVLLRMKEVFNHLFSLQLEEDVNEVVFALCSESSIKEDCFPEAASQLDKLLRWRHPEMGQTVMEASKKITRVK